MHQKCIFFRMSYMGNINLPDGLRKKILISIQREEIKRARVFIVTALVIGLSSITGMIFAFKYAITALTQSGFYRYASLVFSDFDIVLISWKDFILSLTESILLIGLTIALTTILLLLFSIRILVKNSKQSHILSFN